jgi:uncharacterized protein with HEPN domain
MAGRTLWRLKDIKKPISDIRRLLSGKSLSAVEHDDDTQAAFERYLERLSEASRHIPADWKAEFPQIPWRQIADLGNFMRHGYDKVDLGVLWSIYEHDLDALESVIDQLSVRPESSTEPKQ